MATYVLHGLSSSSPISSSEGMSRQPTLEWPNDPIKRPTVLNSGIEFQYGQYLKFSAHFDNQGSDQISVVAWIKRVKKDPGEFLRIGNNFTNASHPQGVGDIGFRVYTILEDDGNIAYRTTGVVNRADISEEYIHAKRWFAIGVGWSQDQAYFKKRKSYPADYGNIRKVSLPVTSWTSGGSYYIGCLNLDCATNSKIIIHSIRVYNDIDPTISLGLADIPFNEYFPCGNGEIETFQGGDYVEECDDGGWANNDGWDEFWIIESGWTCVIDNSTSQSACTIDPVTICQVDHWSICSGNDSNIWQKCEDGYQLLNESTCQYEIVSETAQQMSTTTQAMTGLGAVVSLSSSILNASSPGSLWAMVNQLQLLFFLLLTQSSLPADVRGYITGNSLFSFDMDFGFLPLKDNRLANIPLDWMKKNQTNIALKDMGQESGSSFNNNFCVFIALILLALFHSVLFWVPKKYDYTSPTWKGRFMKATGKLWRAFSFGIYLRFMLEAYQNILLSVVNELKNYDFSSLRMIFSTGIAMLLLLLLGLLVYLSIREAFRISDPDEHSKWGELTNGLRSTKLSQIYTTILILRRVVFWTLLVVFEFLGHSVLIISMLGIEAFYGVYILAVRPFESKVNNLVECLNEVFFFCFIAYLIKFNSDNDWSKVYSDLYIQLMVGNGVIIVIILWSTGIVLSIKKCYLSGSKQTSEPSKVTRFNLREVSASNVKLQLNRQRADPSTGVGMSRQELVKRVKKVVKGLSSSKKVTPVSPNKNSIGYTDFVSKGRMLSANVK